MFPMFPTQSNLCEIFQHRNLTAILQTKDTVNIHYCTTMTVKADFSAIYLIEYIKRVPPQIFLFIYFR